MSTKMVKPAAAPAPAERKFGGTVDKLKSWPERIKAFYNDVRTETRKVTTPTMKEVQATTVVVIIAVFLFGAYFWAIDNIIGHGIDKILKYFSHR